MSWPFGTRRLPLSFQGRAMKVVDSGKVIEISRWRKGKMEPKKVLVVEDEMDMRVFITTLLETSGYKPAVAQKGQEGFERAKSEKPALILLDVMMAKEGGIQLYRRLKTDPALSHIPVVVISAISRKTFFHSQSMLDEARGQSLPEPEGYIEKPPEADELLQEIRRVLSQGLPASS
jgi:two-component system phosphate regulon response regulator PhoB